MLGFLTGLACVGMVSIIYSCLVVSSRTDDAEEEYWRRKQNEDKEKG